LKPRLLMVCLGNICRSPLAKEIMAKKTAHLNIEVDSAGTANYHENKPADVRSVAVAKSFGLNLSAHRARAFQKSDFQNFTHIFVMDQQNYKDLLSLAENENEASKIQLICPTQKEVPDPFYENETAFLKVFHILEAACTEQAKKLKI